MVNINVTPDNTRNASSISEAKKIARKAMVGKLSKAAYDGWYAFGKELRQKVDRPTPFTLKAARYKKAKLSVLQAEVFLNPIQEKYLSPIIEGRSYQGELLGKWRPVPFDIAKNKYGNLRANLSKRDKYFSSKRNNRGKKYLGRRLSKGKTKLIARWVKNSSHDKVIDFYGIVEGAAKRSFVSM